MTSNNRAHDGRRIDTPIRAVGEDFATEQPLLRPLPAEEFEPGLWLTPRVDRYSRVTVRQCHYSVPIYLIGRQVRVSPRASEVVIFFGRRGTHNGSPLRTQTQLARLLMVAGLTLWLASKSQSANHFWRGIRRSVLSAYGVASDLLTGIYTFHIVDLH
ncbi:hypothetical protein [Rhodococcus sp. USK10]|uniref:Mu transposase domain-containing protein n=1 Tax=Rhodococcus sp. USK10 TaxID=2789739 RepID=UPI0035B54146